MEYHAGQQWHGSDDQKLMYNLKKPMNKRGQKDWEYKNKAIQECGNICKSIFDNFQKDYLIIPIPPSKTKDSSDYDNRLIQILKIATANNSKLQYCEDYLIQTENYSSSHNNSENRISLNRLKEIYTLDLSKLNSDVKNILIFDDVITAGVHFRAVSNKLRINFDSAIDIKGFFIARTIHNEGGE